MQKILIMTIEKTINYEGILTLNSINQECLPLLSSDVIDENSDLQTSLKMTDIDGRTILLLEAKSQCIDDSEINRNIVGCHIVRFEYVKQMMEQPLSLVLEKFIRAFITNVTYKLVPLPDSSFKTQYQYMWCDSFIQNNLIISYLLDLNKHSIGDYCIYSGNIPQ